MSLLRRSPLKRTGRLRPMSKKRQREARTYSLLRAAFLQAHPVCQMRCSKPSKDVHHTQGRLGGNYLNVETWLAVCRSCHDWIHSHPKEARALNLLPNTPVSQPVEHHS